MGVSPRGSRTARPQFSAYSPLSHPHPVFWLGCPFTVLKGYGLPHDGHLRAPVLSGKHPCVNSLSVIFVTSDFWIFKVHPKYLLSFLVDYILQKWNPTLLSIYLVFLSLLLNKTWVSALIIVINVIPLITFFYLGRLQLWLYFVFGPGPVSNSLRLVSWWLSTNINLSCLHILLQTSGRAQPWDLLLTHPWINKPGCLGREDLPFLFSDWFRHEAIQGFLMVSPKVISSHIQPS